MFGFKRRKAASIRARALIERMEDAYMHLKGWNRVEHESVLKIGIPACRQFGSPMTLELTNGSWRKRAELFYYVDGRYVKLAHDRIHYNLGGSYTNSFETDPEARNVLDEVYAQIDSLINDAVNLKDIETAHVDELRRKVLANLAYGSLTEQRVIAAGS